MPTATVTVEYESIILAYAAIYLADRYKRGFIAVTVLLICCSISIGRYLIKCLSIGIGIDFCFRY